MTRRGDWIRTYTGRQFWPLDPGPEDVCMAPCVSEWGAMPEPYAEVELDFYTWRGAERVFLERFAELTR